jgi:hypothetical protein
MKIEDDGHVKKQSLIMCGIQHAIKPMFFLEINLVLKSIFKELSCFTINHYDTLILKLQHKGFIDTFYRKFVCWERLIFDLKVRSSIFV